jgi:hypothetical protein
MKGRAHQIFREFQLHAANAVGPFGVSRVILLARIVPESLTPDVDDPELEERLERAIQTVQAKAS